MGTTHDIEDLLGLCFTATEKKNNEVKFLKNFKILKLKSVCRDDSLKLCNIEKPSTES